MRVPSSDHVASYYAATANPSPPAPPLESDRRVDVCVVGGGYTGLSTALHLARRGRQVALLEQARLGWGASGRNGGQIHIGFRRDQSWLEQHLGATQARAIWDLSQDAYHAFHAVMKEESIACDWRAGLMHLDHRARFVADSHAYARDLQDRYAYDGFTPLNREQACTAVDSTAYYGGVFSRDGGQVHALNWALGLAQAAHRYGASLHEYSPARQLTHRNGLWHVASDKATVVASDVVIAGNGYLRGLEPTIESHVMPINNFIATTKPLAPDQAQRLIRDGLAVSDSRFVVYYFRITPDHRLLFGGGENYSYRLPKNMAAHVRPHIRRIFPQLRDVPLDYAWGGTLAVTRTRLPFVRRLQPGLYTASGYSGQGITMAPYFGRLIADVILHESSQFDLLSRLPASPFPGGTLLRWPILVSAMLALRLRDML